VAGLHQYRGDGNKWVEVSGRRCRSDKNFHKTFRRLVGEIEAVFGQAESAVQPGADDEKENEQQQLGHR
jgi:hypothetical protein